MGSNKDKGTRAETAVVRLARESGFPYAERRALTGGKDRGDITGIPGVVIQVKDHAERRIKPWQLATLDQAYNDGATTCLLVVKIPRKNVREWDAFIPVYQLLYECPQRYAFGGESQDLEWARLDLATAFKWLKEAGY